MAFHSQKPADEAEEYYIKAFREGNEAGLTYVFNLHYPDVKAYISRILKGDPASADIASATFYSVWKKRKRIDDLSKLKSYLMTTAMRKALNHLRSVKTRNAIKKWLPVKESKDPHLALHTKLMIQKAHELIRQLPEKKRKMIQETVIEGRPVKDFAVEHGMSPEHVRSEISKILKPIRKKLNGYK